MANHPVPSCPEPVGFAKWFEKQAANNANHRPDIVEISRFIPIVATEAQINDEYNLVHGAAEPGAVLAKLQECGFKVRQYQEMLHPDEGFLVEMEDST